ncbi:MAG: hydantoinase/oxoprolinase family protein [Gemmatimonadaceae bacterium]
MTHALAAGVDVGGTFTDCAAIAPDGRVITRKVLSTPDDQSDGVAAALAALGTAVSRVVHGTTVVTNLLLERTGARVVLCASAGASDLLELRRQDRASLYDLSAQHPPPLVARLDVVPVAERQGPLALAELTRAVAAVLALEPEVVVVAFLDSHADDANERTLAGALRRARPGLEVVTSAQVLPEIREYERTSTAVAEGYARPRVARYLERLTARLAEGRFPAPAVMTSGGGMRHADEAAHNAASLALSGPAGGVVGAAAALRAAIAGSGAPRGEFRAASIATAHALTIDIGGTSADAGLILDGEPLVEQGGTVAGVPIALPRVLVETVSAGGGSIAWVDDGGALRVGPRSAGARPGPVAFARGGIEPTVTDAQVALGRIGASGLSGGVMLDVEGARAAVARLAGTLAEEPARVARAIVDAADAEMARALRRVSVDRGVDPRDCTLIAFGGGGPLHACALADALSMTTVLVPPFAGVLSAVGLALAPERHESAVSVLRGVAELDSAALGQLVERLASQVQGDDRRTVARVRYVGQGYELDIRVEPHDDGAAVAARFETAHRSRYGFTLPRAVEVVALRHSAGQPGVTARFARDAALPAWDGRVDAGGPARGAVVHGAASVSLGDATLWVADGWLATALETGGWLLAREGAS